MTVQSKHNSKLVRRGRVIALIDIDCFAVQLIRQLEPHLMGKPVVAMNKIAASSVSHEAKQLVHPVLGQLSRSTVKGKSYLWEKEFPEPRLYFRDAPDNEATKKASKKFYQRIQQYLRQTFGANHEISIQFNSPDEVYIDLTDACCHHIKRVFKTDDLNGVVAEMGDGQFQFEDVPQYSQWSQLILGVLVVKGLMAHILKHTKLICSAGISHNKLVAKMACGLAKKEISNTVTNRLTVLMDKPGIYCILIDYPIQDMEGFQRKRGQIICDELNVKYLAELQNFSYDRLMDIQLNLTDDNQSTCIRDLKGKPKRLIGRIWLKCRAIDNNAVRFHIWHKETDSLISFGKEIDCNDYDFTYDLEDKCQELADKLEDLRNGIKENETIDTPLIPQRLKIEVYTKYGHNSNTSVKLGPKPYGCDDLIKVVNKTGFPWIGCNRFPKITGFRLIAIDLKPKPIH